MCLTLEFYCYPDLLDLYSTFLHEFYKLLTTITRTVINMPSMYTQLVMIHLFAECTQSQFKCRNSICIDKKLKCDGNNDCGDLSDEGCSEYKYTLLYSNPFLCVHVCAYKSIN